MHETPGLRPRLTHYLTTILRYQRHFGLVRGTRLFLQLYALQPLRRRESTISIQLPISRTPLLLRAGTSDCLTFEQVFLDKEYDFAFPPGFAPRLIIDGGANIGLAALFFANRFPGARIVSIEPEGGNFEMLRKNVAAHPQIRPLKAALWSRREQLRIQNPAADKWLFQVERADDRSRVDSNVEGVTIDQVAEMEGCETIDLLKIDIEGAEKELFSGDCDSWLGKTTIMIVELHDGMVPGCGKAFFTATSKHEFNYFHRGENEILISQRRH